MRVYVESYGCTQNLGEGRALERAARDAGHEVVSGPRGADIGVLVTCGVIGLTEARMVRRYRALLTEVPEVEFIIAADGSLTVTGLPAGAA